MSKRKMTAEYLRAMVKKSFSNVDIDEGGKMCVLPFQSLVDTVDLYEDKLAWQEVDIQQLTEENAELQKQVDELKVIVRNMEQGYYPITQLRENTEKEKEQAVKDKAKEIISLLEDMDKRGMTVPFNMVLRQLKERCGVEVE